MIFDYELWLNSFLKLFKNRFFVDLTLESSNQEDQQACSRKSATVSSHLETPMHSKNQQVVDMELSKTSFDVDLDEVDTDIPWLKSVPSSADIEDHRLKKKPGQSSHNCDICQKSFKGKHNLIVHLRVHKGPKGFRI